MNYTWQDYQTMLEDVRKQTSFMPRLGLVLGSGLDDFIQKVTIAADVAFNDIRKHPLPTNPAHKGHYLFGTYAGIPLVIMEGRLHFYEGYSAPEIVSPIRLLKLMGIQKLILTNACGGIRYAPGTMMLISDSITTNVPSPLVGKNMAEFGPRFPDMSDPWDEKDRHRILPLAKAKGLPVEEGVFMQFTGPQYETKAEIRMAQICGADAVGMSTAIEDVASTQMGIPTLGIATIANWACGIANGPISDDQVLKASDEIGPTFAKLLDIAIPLMSQTK